MVRLVQVCLGMFFKFPRKVPRLPNRFDDVKNSVEWKNNSIMNGRAGQQACSSKLCFDIFLAINLFNLKLTGDMPLSLKPLSLPPSSLQATERPEG